MKFFKIRIIPNSGDPTETIMKEEAVLKFQQIYGNDRIINLGPIEEIVSLS